MGHWRIGRLRQRGNRDVEELRDTSLEELGLAPGRKGDRPSSGEAIPTEEWCKWLALGRWQAGPAQRDPHAVGPAHPAAGRGPQPGT